MIELLNIFSFSLFLTLFFYSPFFKKNISNKNNFFDNYDLKNLSFLILINLLLILKLLNLNVTQITNIFYSIIFVFIIYFLTNFKKFVFEKNIYFYFFINLMVLFILSIQISNNLILYWDAQKLWLPKAIVLYNDGSISDLKNTFYSHYSFLGSLTWAFFWKISNFEHEYYGRIFYLALYCFGLFNFLSLIKLDRNLKTISFLLLVMITYDYWHFRGTQEILIFSFLLILSKYLFNLILENKSSKFNLIIIILFLNLIIWTKNEGILLTLIISFIILIFFKENLRFKLIFLSVTIFLIFLRFAIFKFYGLDLDLSQDFDFSNIITIFMNNFKTANIYIILKYVVYSTVKFPHIILSLFFALMIIFDRKLFKKIIFLYVYLFLSIFLIFFIYLSSPQKLEFMVSTGSLRLLFEFSAPYLLFILFFFRERIKI